MMAMAEADPSNAPPGQGALHVFGRNSHGQLGLGDSDRGDRLAPVVLDLEATTGVPGTYASLLAAGEFHTLVFLRLPAATSTGAEAAALYAVRAPI
jgi:hypothetical protein